MWNFSDLSEARDQVSVHQGYNKEKYIATLAEAKDLLTKFVKNRNLETLKKAMLGFTESLGFSSHEAEPYFYLAIGYSMIGKMELCQEYFDIASKIEPYYEGLNELREELGLN